MCTQLSERIDTNECDEQQLCKKCGLCCNGTLFSFVLLVDEDIPHIETHMPDLVVHDRKKSFKQPCRYYQNKSCRIYKSWKPHTCSVFECKLLIRFRQKEISFMEAVNVITQTVERVEHVRNRLTVYTGDNESVLSTLFNNYVNSHPDPDQTLILAYGVVQVRLKRDFRKVVTPQDSAASLKTEK